MKVAGETTEDSLTFANPDGTFTAEISSGPVRMRQGSRWVPIDTSLVRDNGRWRPTAAPANLSFSDGGRGEFASLERAGKRLGLRWEGKSLPSPTIDGDTATYSDVLPGADLVVQAFPQGFSESVVLHERPSGVVEFRLPLSLVGASLSRTASGGLRLADDNGKQLASAPPARMWGSELDPHSQEPTQEADVSVGIDRGGSRPVLVLRPDPAFLSDPAVTYPVTVDPTTTLSPSTDTWVATNYPSSQRGSPELKSGTYDGGTTKARSFLKFKLPAAVNGTDIVDTNFQLFNYYSYSCTDGPVAVRRITEDWDPATVSWSGTPGQPSGTTTGEVVKNESHGYSSACPGAFINFDTDAIVQYWANNPTKNYGLKVVSSDETNSYSWHRFRSANYVSGTTNEPKLTVNYNSYPNTASTPVVSPTQYGYTYSRTPTLKSTISDPDGGELRAKFTVYNSGGSAVWSGYSCSSIANATCTTSGSAAQVDVPGSAGLVDGATYSVKAWAEDSRGDLSSTASSATTFVVDTGQPPPDTPTEPQVKSDTLAPLVSATLTSPSPTGLVRMVVEVLDGTTVAGTYYSPYVTSGEATFIEIDDLLPGAYTTRIWADNGEQRSATSATAGPFAVGPGTGAEPGADPHASWAPASQEMPTASSEPLAFTPNIPEGFTMELDTTTGFVKVLDTSGSHVGNFRPYALDDSQQRVSTSVTVDGGQLLITVTPTAGTVFPVLVGPVYEELS